MQETVQSLDISKNNFMRLIEELKACNWVEQKFMTPEEIIVRISKQEEYFDDPLVATLF